MKKERKNKYNIELRGREVKMRNEKHLRNSEERRDKNVQKKSE